MYARTAAAMKIFQTLTQGELADLLVPLSRPKRLSDKSNQIEIETKKIKQARYRAKQIFHWYYQRSVRDWDLMTDLAKELREWCKLNLKIYEFQKREEINASDGTTKFVWWTEDNRTIESVLIPADEEVSRLTACVSSQVGCAMDCGFCSTGGQGFERNLEVHEIVAQIHELKMMAPVTNVVFMGMGEPLNNFETVTKSCRIILDQDGLNFSKRKVTISTCGIVPKIDELGKTLDVSLAVSLNATTDEQRNRIMPINRKWNIASLLEACRRFPLGSHRRITFEYVLLKDFNDTDLDAERLTKLVRGIPSKINLIVYNEFPGSEFRKPEEEKVKKFQRILMDNGLTALVRASRGQEILAACGQLRSRTGST